MPTSTIQIKPTSTPRLIPVLDSNLGFGKHFTDHAFFMKWNSKKGWHSKTVCDRDALPSIGLSAKVLNYGQGLFEGIKAFKTNDGVVQAFRPDSHIKRLNNGAKRLCLPQVNFTDAWDGISELLRLDSQWIPEGNGSALYLRPVLAGVEESLGVSSATECLFYVLASPVSSYYKDEGFGPVKILVSEEHIRAFPGGTGNIKAIGNYAGSLLAADIAKNLGYTQVLWLDAIERQYVEEVGTMNIFFVFEGKIVTPELSAGTILAGITRDSVIKLCRDEGMVVEERKISIKEIVQRSHDGTMTECFGTGTAVVISPVSEIGYQDMRIKIGVLGQNPIAASLFSTISETQIGKQIDRFGWIRRLNALSFEQRAEDLLSSEA
jgi:branched-chain amino acid aminotransferase